MQVAKDNIVDPVTTIGIHAGYLIRLMFICPVFLRLLLHLCKTGVVVREFFQMSQCDLARLDLIVIRDVCLQVSHAVLQLDPQASMEFLEPDLFPIDAQGISDPSCILLGEFPFW